MINTINEILNSPVFLIIASLIIFVVFYNLDRKRTMETKKKIFETLINTRDRRGDVKIRKILTFIPKIFKRSPKVKEALKAYVLSLDPALERTTENKASLAQDSANKYDNLITEIGRDIKVYKDNECYQHDQE